MFPQLERSSNNAVRNRNNNSRTFTDYTVSSNSIIASGPSAAFAVTAATAASAAANVRTRRSFKKEVVAVANVNFVAVVHINFFAVHVVAVVVHIVVVHFVAVVVHFVAVVHVVAVVVHIVVVHFVAVVVHFVAVVVFYLKRLRIVLRCAKAGCGRRRSRCCGRSGPLRKLGN